MSSVDGFTLIDLIKTNIEMLMNMQADPEDEGLEITQKSIEDPDLFIGLP